MYKWVQKALGVVCKLGKRSKIAIIFKESALIDEENHDLKVECIAICVEVSDQILVSNVKTNKWNLFTDESLRAILLCDLVWIRND